MKKAPDFIYLKPDHQDFDCIRWQKDQPNESECVGKYVRLDIANGALTALVEIEAKIKDRFKNIIDGPGITIPRIAIKVAIDDIFPEKS